jgi:hypothetical protein
MSDLISRSALLERMRNRRKYLYKKYGANDPYVLGFCGGLAYVEQYPAVDAVAVVRCKDCEYGYKADAFGEGCILCGTHDRVTGPDDFCDCGQKRKRVKHEAD